MRIQSENPNPGYFELNNIVVEGTINLQWCLTLFQYEFQKDFFLNGAMLGLTTNFPIALIFQDKHLEFQYQYDCVFSVCGANLTQSQTMNFVDLLDGSIVNWFKVNGSQVRLSRRI